MGMKKKELIFVILLVVGFLLPPALFGQWWLFGVFMLFFICFGITEFIATKATGKTVSQHFWALRAKSKAKAWIIIAGMAIAWLALLYHLIIQ